MHHCLFVWIHLITYLIDWLLFENMKQLIMNEHTKRWGDAAWVLELKPELMGALHSHPYECPVSVLMAIWNFTQQCRRSQNDLWLNTAQVGWRYSRTSRATGIKEPPACCRDTEVYSYPATRSHLRFRKQQIEDLKIPNLETPSQSKRGWWIGWWMVNRKMNGGGQCIQKCVNNEVFWNWIVLYQRNMRSALHAICNNADGSMVGVERGLAVPVDGWRILDSIDINIRGPSAERGERDSEIMQCTLSINVNTVRAVVVIQIATLLLSLVV
jgi:hypothetical protein